MQYMNMYVILLGRHTNTKVMSYCGGSKGLVDRVSFEFTADDPERLNLHKHVNQIITVNFIHGSDFDKRVCLVQLRSKD